MAGSDTFKLNHEQRKSSENVRFPYHPFSKTITAVSGETFCSMIIAVYQKYSYYVEASHEFGIPKFLSTLKLANAVLYFVDYPKATIPVFISI